jgi:hypothetical protein
MVIPSELDSGQDGADRCVYTVVRGPSGMVVGKEFVTLGRKMEK